METFLQQVIDADTSLLLLLNGCHNEATDLLMWAVSSRLSWLLPACALIAISVRHGWRQALLVIATLATAVLIADQLSSGLIKPWVMRSRPSHVEALADMLHIVNDYRGGAYGFVSSHAANSLALSLTLGLLLRNRIALTLLLLWTALQCYSRVYLGVHYPGDILGGLIIGLIAAWAALTIYGILARRKGMHITFSAADSRLMTIAICANFIAILLAIPLQTAAGSLLPR